MASGVNDHLQPGSPLLLTCALAIVALVYFCGWLRLRRVPRMALPFSRLAAFVGGLFSVWIALGSRLAPLDEQLLTVHMVKHLLLMALGAPLFCLAHRVCHCCTGFQNASVPTSCFSVAGHHNGSCMALVILFSAGLLALLP